MHKLENTLLRERSQIPKDTECGISLVGDVRNRERTVDAQGWGGEWRVSANRDGVSSGEWNVLVRDTGAVCTTRSMYQMPLSCTV